MEKMKLVTEKGGQDLWSNKSCSFLTITPVGIIYIFIFSVKFLLHGKWLDCSSNNGKTMLLLEMSATKSNSISRIRKKNRMKSSKIDNNDLLEAWGEKGGT